MSSSSPLSYEEIYQHHAAEYDDLVNHEDYRQSLTSTLNALVELRRKKVLEFGAGTGRLTKFLCSQADHVHAFDGSPAMLEQARKNLAGFGNFTLAQSDHLHTNAESSSCDVAIEGWSFGHSIIADPENWSSTAEFLVKEMLRVLRSGGIAIIIETLGTGSETPRAPARELDLFYRYLESEGFTRVAIRTDYKFSSVEEAERVLGFFFGERMIKFLGEHASAVIPECTGIWHRIKV